LLREARDLLGDGSRGAATPAAGPVSEAIALRMAPGDPQQLPGTAYRLGRTLGEGGAGIVYEAEHIDLARRVALKVLSPQAAELGAFERFRAEARTLAALSHPNIVDLYDFGSSLDGRVYFAMQLCAGETLAARLRRGHLEWPAAAHVAIEVARALEAIHAARLVHRDVKPENLILDSAKGSETPAVKLVDFGLAAPASRGLPPEQRRRLARGFVVQGTPEYMAPEQVADEDVDGRADVYALGCVLYEMLTGVRPFDGPSTVAVMGKQLRETPRPPKAWPCARAVPRTLDAIVVRAMKKQPEDRFRSAAEMRAALEAAVVRPDRSRLRWRVAGAAAAMATAALAAGAWMYDGGTEGSAQPATSEAAPQPAPDGARPSERITARRAPATVPNRRP
jgi:serine/threonine-protein kinase